MIWKLVTRKYGKRHVDRTLWMCKKHDDICVPHERSPKGYLSKQRKIFIIKWIRWPVMWIPVSFFPQPPLSSPNKPMNKVAIVAGMEVMHGLSKTDFHSPKSTWLQPLLSTQYVSSRDQHLVVLWHGTIPWSRQPATWWQEVDYIGPLPSWSGQHFILTEIDNYSGYGFAFPAHNASAKNHQPKIYGMPYPPSWYPITLFLITELTSQQK